MKAPRSAADVRTVLAVSGARPSVHPTTASAAPAKAQPIARRFRPELASEGARPSFILLPSLIGPLMVCLSLFSVCPHRLPAVRARADHGTHASANERRPGAREPLAGLQAPSLRDRRRSNLLRSSPFRQPVPYTQSLAPPAFDLPTGT